MKDTHNLCAWARYERFVMRTLDEQQFLLQARYGQQICYNLKEISIGRSPKPCIQWGVVKYILYSWKTPCIIVSNLCLIYIRRLHIVCHEISIHIESHVFFNISLFGFKHKSVTQCERYNSKNNISMHSNNMISLDYVLDFWQFCIFHWISYLDYLYPSIYPRS